MNGIITNLMEEWGFNMPSNIFTPMVYIISTISFCLVFWIITKVVSPGASHLRSFVMKYVCVVMAIVVCLSCVSTYGITINLEKNEDDTPAEPEEPDALVLKDGFYIVSSNNRPPFGSAFGMALYEQETHLTDGLTAVFMSYDNNLPSADITINGDPFTLYPNEIIFIDDEILLEVLIGYVSVVTITTYTIEQATQ